MNSYLLPNYIMYSGKLPKKPIIERRFHFEWFINSRATRASQAHPTRESHIAVKVQAAFDMLFFNEFQLLFQVPVVHRVWPSIPQYANSALPIRAKMDSHARSRPIFQVCYVFRWFRLKQIQNIVRNIEHFANYMWTLKQSVKTIILWSYKCDTSGIITHIVYCSTPHKIILFYCRHVFVLQFVQFGHGTMHWPGHADDGGTGHKL